jgi:cell division protein DivIC
MFHRDSILMRSLRNKYLIAVLVFLVWLLIFDQNSLIDRVKYLRTRHDLETEKQYYLERIDEDSRRLNELRTDRDNLEKFAREQYLMKEENEDIFVIVPED